MRTCWELGKPFGNKTKLKILFSPQPIFGVPRVEIGPIESTLHVIDFCVLFRHYYRQDAKYFLMNFVFDQSKGILWGEGFKGDKTFLPIILLANWVYILVIMIKFHFYC